MLAPAPRLLVDVGCGTGATGREAKRRFPGITVVGFEYSPSAAAIARAHLDTVIEGDVESADFTDAGLAPGSVDAVLLADVLEHLYDPWTLLVRLRPLLRPDAQIIASIPNVRNLVLLSELAAGDFPYADAGLLDVTHIRFFTRAGIVRLFAQTGYDIVEVRGADDARIPPYGEVATPADVTVGSVTLRNLDREALLELRTIQFYVKAVPAAHPANS